MTGALLALALFANGVATGVMLGNAIGLAAFALRLPYAGYVDLIKFLWPRYDPFLPIMNALAFGLDIALAVMSSGERAAAAGLFWLAAALLAVLMAISLVKNVPINKYVTALDPASQPNDWPERDPRVRWKNWNTARVVLSLAALIANLVAAALLL
ncbi:anthrone oxygenase family protein [Nonomuraea sp. NPDC049400]|uniref:anthrone oxygenase family protein n=1 Tax=Nonomuraea sp. NPDC049400 TaxID=3364352 RepID=UPI00378E6E22